MADDTTKTWLKTVLPRHQRLRAAAASLLENMLKERNIEYLDVQSRVKDFDSTLEKIERKNYKSPADQLTDLTGVRVVTFLESQVEQVAQAIRHLFEIDDKNSLDRASILGNDKIGYRSTHFVCSLGKKRELLPEYEGLGALKFEIQVRTVLQHAWAELAHDRSFKFGPGLPAAIERKLNLYSGMLEIVDGGFDSISNEIDDYQRSLEKKTLDQISDVEISALSLNRFVDAFSKKNGLALLYVDIPESGLLQELKHFGIDTIGQLETLANGDFIAAERASIRDKTNRALIRDILMYSDIERYLAGPFRWRRMTADTFNLLIGKYGEGRVRKLLRDHKIERA